MASSTNNKLAVNAESETEDSKSYDRLSDAFEKSARRWELIVYPSLFAFVILAAYGFYLVFSLAKDIHMLVLTVDSNMSEMSANMRVMTEDVSQLSHNIRTMTVSVDNMADDMRNLEPMLTNISEMNRSMHSITFATHRMGNDMSTMNHSIGRPMSFMNTFMPW